MNRLLLAIGLLIGCATGFSQTTTAAKTFVSKEGRFSVQLPSLPTVSLPKPLKDAVSSGSADYTIDSGNSAYIVSFAELTPLVASGPDTVLDAMRDDLKSKGELLSEKKISLENYPGREIAVARDAANSMRARIFVVNNRKYSVMYSGPNSMVNSPATDSYLNSFKLFEPHPLPDSWQAIDTGDGKFTIRMPVTPMTRTDKTSVDGDMHIWLSTDMATKATYLAGYSVLKSIPVTPAAQDKILDNSRAGTVDGLGAKLVEERWLSIGGNRGRELSLKIMQGDTVIGLALARIVIVGSRLIQFGVVGQVAAMDKGRVDDYMDSFKLEPLPASAK